MYYLNNIVSYLFPTDKASTALSIENPFPDTIWMEIFSHCNFQQLQTSSLVCRKFRDLTKTCFSKIRLVDLTSYKNAIDDEKIKSVFFKCPQLQEISISSSQTTDHSILSLPNGVKVLRLTCAAKVTNYSLSQLKKGLEELHLTASAVDGVFFRYLPKSLKVLTLDFCPNVNPYHFESIQKQVNVKVTLPKDIIAPSSKINSYSSEILLVEKTLFDINLVAQWTEHYLDTHLAVRTKQRKCESFQFRYNEIKRKWIELQQQMQKHYDAPVDDFFHKYQVYTASTNSLAKYYYYQQLFRS